MGGKRSALENVDYFQVRITPRSQRLLEAWQAGDEQALRDATTPHAEDSE
jgi:hypothetical protein